MSPTTMCKILKSLSYSCENIYGTLWIVHGSSFTTSKGSMFGITTSTPLVLIVVQVENLWKQKHKALTIINLSIKDKIIWYVMGIQEPKDVWVVLTKIIETKYFFRQMLIQNKLTNRKMDKATSMEDFLVNNKDLLN